MKIKDLEEVKSSKSFLFFENHLSKYVIKKKE